jgi:YegS/Rv2252/BmrU family lipid kinase
MKITVILNPIAGRKRPKRFHKALQTLKSRGLSPTVLKTQRRGDAYRFALSEVEKETSGVLVAGGDGTVNEVVGGLTGSEVRLGVLPLGTANVFALETGIPFDPARAAQVFLEGKPSKIPLGRIRLMSLSRDEIEERNFLLWSGAGFDAGVLREFDRALLPLLGKAAYVYTGLKVVSRYTSVPISVRTDGGDVFAGYSAIVARIRRYGGRFQLAPRASLFNDRFDLVLFESPGPWNMLRYAVGIVMRRHIYYRDVRYVQVAELDMNSEEEVYVQVDGDLVGRLPAHFEITRDALTVMLPTE